MAVVTHVGTLGRRNLQGHENVCQPGRKAIPQQLLFWGCEVGQTGAKKRTDYGTIIFHWLLVGSLAIAIATGLRIATEAPGRTWINLLDPVLPEAAVWTDHLQSAAVLIGVSIAYILYVRRLRLRQRLRLDRVRLRGLLGRPYARWGTINICLYWAFFLVMLSQLMTGTLLYLGYANSFMVQMHWLGLWFIVAYIVLHLIFQWQFGGAAQLLRIVRPTRHVPASRKFELADMLALLDEQPSPSLAPRQSVFAASLADPSPAFARQSSTAERPQVSHRAEVGADTIVARRQRRSTKKESVRGSPIKPPAVQLSAFVIACVTASLVVGGILTVQKQLVVTLYIPRITAANIPVIDGETSDPIWQTIMPLYVQTENGGNFQGTGETTVSIRAVHDAVRAYFLFVWNDPTRSLKQLPLRKVSGGWQLLHDGFENGDEHSYNEDKFSVLLTTLDTVLAGDTTFHAGARPLPDEPPTLSGRGLHYTTRPGLIADVWEWKAASTNASGYCDDDHFGAPAQATPAQLDGLAPYHGGFEADPGSANYENNFALTQAGNYAEGVVPRRLPASVEAMTAAMGRVDLDPDHGESEAARWFMTEDDSVALTPERDRLIPAGTLVPGVVISGQYSGDRADVRCAARWAAGQWALEVTRRLDTGSPYDLPIKTGTFMRVAAFDHAQIRHTRHVRPLRLEVE
jgi:ethylbenzene dehydrogenase/cytochrome b561-like protein